MWRDGSGELDVAHALAAHLGARDLDAAALADDALEADALVLAAGALPVLGGAEDLLAEQAVLLGLEGAVVDRSRASSPRRGTRQRIVGTGKANVELVEVVYIEYRRHSLLLPLNVVNRFVHVFFLVVELSEAIGQGVERVDCLFAGFLAFSGKLQDIGVLVGVVGTCVGVVADELDVEAQRPSFPSPEP